MSRDDIQKNGCTRDSSSRGRLMSPRMVSFPESTSSRWPPGDLRLNQQAQPRRHPVTIANSDLNELLDAIRAGGDIAAGTAC